VEAPPNFRDFREMGDRGTSHTHTHTHTHIYNFKNKNNNDKISTIKIHSMQIHQ
jgi:hypothetical protein